MLKVLEDERQEPQKLQPGEDYSPELKEKMQMEMTRRVREQGPDSDIARGR